MIIVSKEDKDFLADDDFENGAEDQNPVSSERESTESDEEVVAEEKADESSCEDNEDITDDNGYSSQFGELEEFVDNSTDLENASVASAEKKRKSLSTKQISIIAVVAIVLVAVIALGAYFVFFNNSIKSGAWVPVSIDETTQEVIESDDETTKQYYKFTDTQMVVYYANGYATSESSCNITYDGNTFVMQDGTGLTLTYEISGNLIKGKFLTLTIAGYEEQPLTYKWSPNVDIPELTGPEFTVNEEILGYWKYTNGSNIVYKEFTEDGITNEYTAYEGTRQKYSQMYNYDGENITTLSPGGTNLYGETVDPGTEETNQAVIEGDTLTLYQSSIPYEFTRSSKEEYEEYESAVLAGTYEYPTVDYSQYEVDTEVATTETTEEVTTEAVTEVATEEVTQ